MTIDKPTWASYASGKVTVKVPKDAKATPKDKPVEVKLTYEKDGVGKVGGAGNQVKKSTAKGVVTLKITVEGGADDDGDDISVATTTVIGGVLAGSMMAASLMSPPTPQPAPSKGATGSSNEKE